MNYKYLWLFLLPISIYSQGQVVNIPDTNFKNKLLQHSPVIDTNGDGEIQIAEAADFQNYMDVSTEYNASDDVKISSMTGIEAFVNIYGLSFQNNLVTAIDLSNNTLLTSLNCSHNKLTALEIDKDIVSLRCNSNNISELDVSKNEFLQELFCEHNNLSSLDVSSNILLYQLSCQYNNLSNLDVSNLVRLEKLTCSSNEITQIDVSQNVLLDRLIISNNLITNIELSENTALTSLDCKNNNLTNLDVSKNTLLSRLFCGRNSLVELDVSKNVLLEFLYCENTDIENLDISTLINLRRFVSYQVPLTSLDVSNNASLEYFISGDNGLTSLDFSNNINLRSITCNNAYLLENVNLKNSTNVTSLSVVRFRNCPNLRTVCVDDVTYAEDNWAVRSEIPQIDANTTFVDDCEIILPYNSINGKVSYNHTNNGCDIADEGLPNILIKATDGIHDYATLTDSNGNYNLSVLKNAYETEPKELSKAAYLSTTPLIHTNTFTAYNTISNDNNFCATFNEDVNDVGIIIIPITEAQPGEISKYQIVYENLGSSHSEGTISLEFDDALTSFQSAVPSQNSSTFNTISFNYSELKPFEKRIIELDFNTASTANYEDKISFTTSISPIDLDNHSNDNSYTYNQPIENASLTNKKEVLQGAEITIDEVGNYLDYVIRFHNTSTETANNIAIVDLLNYFLEWDTIKIISSSHDFRIKISDSRIVEFIFENINLPAQQDDPAGSKGFIAFKVKPPETLEVGNIISGKTKVYYDLNETTTKLNFQKNALAKITYDYSAAVETNEVSTIVVESSTLSNTSYKINESVKLFPNPVRNNFSIKVSKNTIIEKISIYSVTGKKLLAPKTHNSVDLSALNSGVYFVKIETNLGKLYKRIIKN